MSQIKKTKVALVREPDHPDAAETFERLSAKSGVGNIHRVLANSPTVFKNFIGLSHALRYSSDLDPIDRELAICCVLERHEGHYELEPHRRFAKILGASDEQIQGVRHPFQPGLYNERQLAVLRFAELFAADLAERDQLPDPKIEAVLGDRERVELGLTLALYMGLAHFTSLIDVPDEDFAAADAPSMERAASGN